MNLKRFSFVLSMFFMVSVTSCGNHVQYKRTVIAIPVYGQSLALGEQSIRITDFDTLCAQSHHHVVTENLDEEFGYLSDTHFKQWAKRLLHDRHRAFELSIYGMAEKVNEYLEQKGWGDKFLICTFPGGQGATSIVDMSRGSAAYNKFMDEIRTAHQKAIDKGYGFIVPAYCWMQGEDDVVWKKSTDYKRDLKRFQTEFSEDIKSITRQRRDVVCISYQTNCLTLAKDYKNDDYNNKSTYVPQAQLDLTIHDPSFMTSGPTYPYTFVGNSAHIDGLSMKILGYLQGLSIIRLFESKKSLGLVPQRFAISGDTAIIDFNVPSPPLVLDTELVAKASNYGFSVIDTENHDILEQVFLEKGQVKLLCKRVPEGCKVRYAVNGVKGKTGGKERSRGNLRDSQGRVYTALIDQKRYPLNNWSHQFDVLMR